MDLSKTSREELIRQLKLFRSKNMFQVLTETIAAAVFVPAENGKLLKTRKKKP